MIMMAMVMINDDDKIITILERERDAIKVKWKLDFMGSRIYGAIKSKRKMEIRQKKKNDLSLLKIKIYDAIQNVIKCVTIGKKKVL